MADNVNILFVCQKYQVINVSLNYSKCILYIDTKVSFNRIVLYLPTYVMQNMSVLFDTV